MGTLKEVKELVDKIHSMTQALVFTGSKETEEQEIEAYAVLMEEREPLVKRLAELKPDAQMTASAGFAAIKKTIAAITEMDKKNLGYMEQLRDGVQDSYRNIKTGQKIVTGYNTLPDDTVSRMFDTKQ